MPARRSPPPRTWTVRLPVRALLPLLGSLALGVPEGQAGRISEVGPAVWLAAEGVAAGSQSAASQSALSQSAPPRSPQSRSAPAPVDTVPTGIRALERRVAARLRSTQPPVAPLSAPLRVRALDISWREPGEKPFLEVDSLRALIAPARLLAGDIVIRHLTLFTPTLRLARAPGAKEWNFERALATLRGGEPAAKPAGGRGASRHLVVIEDAAVRNGSVTIRPPSGEAIVVRDLMAVLPRIAISGARPGEPVADLAHLTATLSLAREGLTFPIALTDAELRFPTGRLDFTAARIIIASSLFTGARGEYRFGAPGLGLDLTVRGERVQLADLRTLLPRAPREGTAVFELRLTTNASGRSTVELSALDLAASGSHIHGSVGFAFGAGAAATLLAVDLTLEPLTIALIEEFTGPLPYGGAITGRIRGPPGRLAFDLTARLTAPGIAEPFTAGLVGTATFAGVGFQLTSLDIDLRRGPLVALRPFIPGLSREGVISGHIFMEGTPGKVPMRVDLRLEVAAGVITLAGTVDLSGAVPRYDLSGNLLDVRLDDLLEPPVPPVILSAHFNLVGTGVKPALASARLRLEGRFTGWQTGPADSVRIVGALERGTLSLDTATLRLATLQFDAAGTWHFEEPASGMLRYHLAATSLAPFAPYFPLLRTHGTAAGSFQASGGISGPLAAPRLAGTLDAATLAYDGWSADSLSATYDLVLQRPLETARVSIIAYDLETPLGPFTEATAMLDLAEPLLSLDIRAEGAAGNGPVVVAASGRIGPGGRRDVTLRELRFNLDGTAWALTHSAHLVWGGGPGFTIEDFQLRQVEGPGIVAISGHYPPTDTGEVRVEVANFPVADLLIAIGYEPILLGSLSLDLRLRGPATEPHAGGTFRLTNGSFRGQAITLLEGTFLTEDRRLDAQAVAQLDTAGTVRLNASLPLVLDLSGVPGVTLPGQEPMRIAATADSLSLGFLALGTPTLQKVEGRLTAEIDVSGTPDRPILAGEATVYNGAVTIVPLHRRYDRITGTFVLAGETITVQELMAHSGGWATINGTITLTELSNPTFDLIALFDGFRAGGGDDHEPAAADGELILTGTLQRPIITGAVTLDDGNIMISAFQSRGPATPVAFAVAPETAGEPVEPALATANQGQRPPTTTASLFDRLVIDDVVITAGPNLWFVTDQFRAQLAGEVILHKVEDGLEISGTLEGDRGIFTLQVGPLVRRFTLQHTLVRFFGTPELNPGLDITASRVIPGAGGQMTEILIHLTGTLRQPHVAITTASGAQVPESELLSFLLFGRPSYAAPGQFPLGGPILEEAVFGIGSIAELASISIEEALIADLGLPLDYFLIQPSQGALGGLGAPTIVLGEEIAPNVYLTVNTGIGGFFGAATTAANAWAVSLQWRITPQWTLEVGVEPVNPARFFRGLGTALPIVGYERQVIVELQRRWTY